MGVITMKTDNRKNASDVVQDADLLTLEEAAEYLCVSKSTLYRMLENNVIHGRKVGRQWRFLQNDLQQYLHRDSDQIAIESVNIEDVDTLTSAINDTASNLQIVIEPIDVNANAQEKVSYFISNLILISIQMNSSDLHLMPGKKVMSIKERVDGVLKEICAIPAATAVAVISRFKAMVDCSVEEKQMPQDGRFTVKHNDNTYDFLASFIPTIYGESMTARRTLQGLPLMKLDDIHLQDDDMQRLRRWMKSPYGTVLFTGPTGSGKVTALYAALREITSPAINTIAIEDPVMYELENVTHISVNMRVGFTIPVALRAIMRHDPDVIVVSEIRDRDTALLTAQCALTGHLMISVLGVGSCLQGIKLLSDFGMEKHLISESMTGIINQRLVRRICSHCRVKTTVNQDRIDEMRKMAHDGGYEMPEKVEFWRGEGCSECHGSGYRGRTGVYALLEFTRKIREAFSAGMPNETIQGIAISEGMHTMAADGIRKAVEGVTTVDELILKEVI